MTDISYTSRALVHRAGNPSPVTAPNASWRLAIAATVLALLLGLGAAGLQIQSGGEANLDGRGKWAGYM